MRRGISIAIALAVAWPLPAQRRAISSQDLTVAHCGARGSSGTIRGTAVYDSGARWGNRRGLWLDDMACRVLVDSTGRFTFLEVAVGAHMLHVATLGIRNVKPIRIRVGPDSTSHVDLHFLPENLVLDCMDQPACAALLGAALPTDSMRDSQRLRAAALRTAIALAGGWRAERDSLTICGQEDDSAVVRAVQRVVSRLVPEEGCVTTDIRKMDILSDGRAVHDRHGGRALIVAVDGIGTPAADVEANLSYYVGPLWAEGWNCRFVRDGATWRPRICKMTWIS